MKHPFNQQLFAYWAQRRGARPAPERSDIDPAAIRTILGDSFLLSREAGQEFIFRVAGTRLCALFGQELRDLSFSAVWDTASAAEISEHCAVIAEEAVGIVAGATARTEDNLSCSFEMLLLPLTLRGRMGARLIGLIAALERPFWLGLWQVQKLQLGAIQYIGATTPAAAMMMPKRLRERARRSLTIIDGGRS